MSKNRYHSLDSLRGIASLQVLISHSLVALPFLTSVVYNNPYNQPHSITFFLLHSPISFLWSDSAAVKVFFVLSGFVLSISYYNTNKTAPNYPVFFFKRIIRLYLPCLAVIIISLVCKKLLYSPNELKGFGDWVQQMWTVPLNYNVLFNLMILKNNLDYFDRALWTLPPEIKLSLILPFFIYLIKKMNKICSVITIIIYIILWHTLNKIGVKNIWPDYPVLYFFTFFMIGSVMSKYRAGITYYINKVSSVQYYLIVAIMFFLYTYKYSFFWLPKHIYLSINTVNDYTSAVAAILVLCITLSQKAQNILNSKPLIFLGKISFSLYLIHIIVIAVFAYTLQNFLNPLFIIILAFLCSFPLSVIFYHCVEVPSLNFANYVSKILGENQYFKKLVSRKFMGEI